jgi:hypothetical protein
VLLAVRTSVPGVATGLAWSPIGGDILFIEATRVPGGGKLILTGQLGEVMRESAQAALSIVKNRVGSFGIEASGFEKIDIHIHVQAGAIPKDGPSAGVAIFMALVSLMTERTVRNDTAMTGEISLRAAHGAGIKRVMLPARNRKDFDDIPEEARKELEFVWLERFDDAVSAALEPKEPTTNMRSGTGVRQMSDSDAQAARLATQAEAPRAHDRDNGPTREIKSPIPTKSPITQKPLVEETMSLSAAASLTSVWRYPVKSMMGEELNASSISGRQRQEPKEMARFLCLPCGLCGAPTGLPLPPTWITLPDGRIVRSDAERINSH